MKSPHIISLMLIALCAVCSCNKGTEQSESILSTRATTEISENISNLDVTSFVQDKTGHIWIGTRRGLNKYTGKEFFHYFSGTSPSSIPENTINDLFLDNEGRMWICTDDNLGINLDNGEFRRVRVNADQGYRASSKLIQLSSGEILMSNVYGNVYLYDSSADAFVELGSSSSLDVPPAISIFPCSDSYAWIVSYGIIQKTNIHQNSSSVSYAYPKDMDMLNGSIMDSRGRIWAYNTSQIVCFDTENLSYTKLPDTISLWLSQKDRSIVSIFSVDDYIILQDNKMCWFYDLINDNLIPQDDSAAPFTFPSSRISTLYQDSEGNIWVGTIGHGFSLCSVRQGPFNRETAMVKSLEAVDIQGIDADADGGIWAVNSSHLLMHVDSLGHKTSYDLSSLPLFNEFRAIDNVLIKYDTTREGLILASGQMLIRMSQPFSKGQESTLFRLSSPVESIALSDDGTIYAGTSTGFLSVIKAEDTPSSFRNFQAFTGSPIVGVDILNDNTVLIYSKVGQLRTFTPQNYSFETIEYENPTGHALRITDAAQDKDGNIYLATRDDGLFVMTAKDRHLDWMQNTTCRTLSSLNFDNEGSLWIGSAYGMNLLPKDSDEIIQFYEDNGVGGNQFSEKATCTLPNGILIFGGAHGITTCSPMIHPEQTTSRIYFESIATNGVLSTQGDTYKGPLSDCPDVTFGPHINNVEIRFAMLDYPRSSSVVYWYKLEGRDNDWAFLGPDNILRLSSLQPGRYTLHISGQIVGEHTVQSTIKIRVKPPFMASNVMIIIYFVLLILLGLSIMNVIRQRMSMTLELEQAQREREHEQFVNKVNMNFFADMAHEFRSPLTMIQGPMKQLIEKKNILPESYRLLNIMNFNVEKMIKLVNQLLDFNKLDNGKLTLSVVKDYDVTAHLSKVIEITSVNAARKNIKISSSGLEKEFRMPLDPDKFESILSNLMSNALKFAGNNGEDGRIHLDFKPSEQYITVTLSNNGKTISDEEMASLFDRYYQVREHALHAKQSGTGIGLNFAHMLAQRMHGNLTARNLEDGSGVEFILELPTDASVYTQTEIIDADLIDIAQIQHNMNSSYGSSATIPLEKTVQSTIEEETEDQSQDNLSTVLVVDDDIDIANYISILLSAFYKVYTANNVKQAMEIINSEEKMPDIILSDIVMPGEDGMSFCRSIKSNMATCHIPVILVSAKVGVDNEVHGLESGSDAYVTKPFDPTYLLALIRSMLKNRSILKGKIAETTSIDDVPPALLSKQDSEFLSKLYDLMEAEMSNPELNIQEICDTMCVSRTKLFYKVKSLTGMSANTLFKTYRLNMAAKMIREGEDNISEVAFKVGFNTPSYFSKAFKAQFGVLPKDYR